jgi:hypothetical protein
MFDEIIQELSFSRNEKNLRIQKKYHSAWTCNLMKTEE